MVLIKPLENRVKFSDTPLGLGQFPALLGQLFFLLCHALVHDGLDKCAFVRLNTPYSLAQVLKDYIGKHDLTDKVSRTGPRVALVVGTAEMVLSVLKADGCTVMQFSAAVCAVHKPGEYALLSRLGRAALVLPQLLNPVPCLPVDDCRVSVGKYLPLIPGILYPLLGLIGFLVALKIDRTARIFKAFQKIRYYPVILGIRVHRVVFPLRQPIFQLVSRGGQDLRRFQPLCNLHRP